MQPSPKGREPQAALTRRPRVPSSPLRALSSPPPSPRGLHVPLLEPVPLTLILGQPSSSSPSLKRGPYIVLLTCPREPLASGIWGDQTWEAGLGLGRGRHSGDRSTRQSSAFRLPLQTGRRQGAGLRAASRSRSQSLPSQDPGSRSLQCLLGDQGPFVAAPQQLRGEEGFTGPGPGGEG